MPDYRRAFVPGGTFFFTLCTHHRRPLFAPPDNIMLLREAVRTVMRRGKGQEARKGSGIISPNRYNSPAP